MDKVLLDKYCNDEKLFRKKLKEYKTPIELYTFLADISNIRGYKLYIKNKWQIPFEDISINSNGQIKAYFYLDGGRSYKTLNGFIRNLEIFKVGAYESYGISYYE